MKTSDGRIRLGAAAERLDRTVQELGQQFRTDAPHGEKDAGAEMVAHRPEFPEIIRLPAGAGVQVHQVPSGDAGIDHESREVTPLLMSQVQAKFVTARSSFLSSPS